MILDIVARATYDTDANTMYVYLRGDKDFKPATTMAITPTMLADLNKAGEIIGLEILKYAKVSTKPKA